MLMLSGCLRGREEHTVELVRPYKKPTETQGLMRLITRKVKVSVDGDNKIRTLDNATGLILLHELEVQALIRKAKGKNESSK